MATCTCGNCQRCYERRWRDQNRGRELARHRADYAKHHADRLTRAAQRRNADRAAYNLRARAVGAIGRAIKRRELTPGPCEHAGGDCRGAIQAHHDDYTKPLQVRWLCRRHHMRLHAALREEAERLLNQLV